MDSTIRILWFWRYCVSDADVLIERDQMAYGLKRRKGSGTPRFLLSTCPLSRVNPKLFLLPINVFFPLCHQLLHALNHCRIYRVSATVKLSVQQANELCD